MNFIQFYLWWDCNNNCKFCFAKLLKEHKSTINERLKALNYVLDYLNNTQYIKEFDIVGLIGGEFFENQLDDLEVYNKFLEVIDKSIELIQSHTISKLFLMTHLIYPKSDKLNEVINKFKLANLTDSLAICTSCDLWGRFHTPERFEMWQNNIKYLRAQNINVHVEFILCQKLIENILSNTFNFKFLDDLGVSFDFLNPQGYVTRDQVTGDTKEETVNHLGTGWLPLRSSFLKFLAYLQCYYPFKLRNLFTLDKRAQELHFIPQNRVQYRDIETYNENIEADTILPCGHSDRFSFYEDSDKCMICDIKHFQEGLD